jgi:hypothetical protein
MPLTANALPSQPPAYAVPYDAMVAFASAQTLTATGDLNNVNAQLDLGGFAPLPGGSIGSGAGRTDGIWILNITAMVLSSDQSYRFHLLGSNDVNFANGNVDLLGFVDFAAVTAGRLIPTLMGPSLPAPTRVFHPFCVAPAGPDLSVFEMSRGHCRHRAERDCDVVAFVRPRADLKKRCKSIDALLLLHQPRQRS